MSTHGTISVKEGGTTVTGSGTNFLSALKVGSTISANNETHNVSAIASDTSLSTDAWKEGATDETYTVVK